MPHLSSPEVNAVEAREFLIHAYNALLNDKIYDYNDSLKDAMIKQVTSDICTAVRTLPKAKQDEFIDYITQRIRRAN